MRPLDDLRDCWRPPSGSEFKAEDGIAHFNTLIDRIEARCMATDGPVTPTLKEMTEDELSDIWRTLQSIRSSLAAKASAESVPQPIVGEGNPIDEQRND